MKVVFLLIFSFSTIVCFAQEQALAKTYEMDLFSIISFGLAIAALLLSFFLGILSWLFYKQSSDSSEKIMSMVSSIESTVAGVQTNITRIIDKAVESWIGTTNIDEISTQGIDEKVKEIESVVKGDNSSDNEVIISQLAELKQQTDDLVRGIREKQMRYFFSNTVEHTRSDAIKVTQENNVSNQEQATGIIRIFITKPTKLATATVRFVPQLSASPKVTAKLISSPYKSNDCISAKPGTPNKSGFNFHLNSKDLLSSGEYVIEYTAIVEEEEKNS